MNNNRYNGFGFTNYETWSVNLWLNNDEPEYNGFREFLEKQLSLNLSNVNTAKNLKE